VQTYNILSCYNLFPLVRSFYSYRIHVCKLHLRIRYKFLYLNLLLWRSLYRIFVILYFVLWMSGYYCFLN